MITPYYPMDIKLIYKSYKVGISYNTLYQIIKSHLRPFFFFKVVKWAKTHRFFFKYGMFYLNFIFT